MKILISRKVEKQLDKIPDRVVEVILGKIRGLVESSENLDIRKLVNRDGFRLRVGDYRVIYKVEARKITVLSVAHRREAYR